jgi:ubiquinone/menaquinone biosynthesis C-methylase UbiE
VKVGRDVLDVGSGSRLLLQEMLKQKSVERVLAIDISKDALKKGRQVIRDARVRFQHRSIYSPVKSLASTFDAAYMHFALHHFEYAQTGLDNTSQALRPGGKLIIQDVLGYED